MDTIKFGTKSKRGVITIVRPASETNPYPTLELRFEDSFPTEEELQELLQNPITEYTDDTPYRTFEGFNILAKRSIWLRRSDPVAQALADARANANKLQAEIYRIQQEKSIVETQKQIAVQAQEKLTTANTALEAENASLLFQVLTGEEL